MDLIAFSCNYHIKYYQIVTIDSSANATIGNIIIKKIVILQKFFLQSLSP